VNFNTRSCSGRVEHSKPAYQLRKHAEQAVGGRPPQYLPALSSLCGRQSASLRRADRVQSADRNLAVGSHSQYVPTLTAAATWRVNAAVCKAAWWSRPLTLWP